MKVNNPSSSRSFFAGSVLFMAYASAEVIVYLSGGKLQIRLVRLGASLILVELIEKKQSISLKNDKITPYTSLAF